MESFSIVKRGYNPQEVDEYIETLEQVIKSYKDKDNAIKNAIISAQVAADNILKNTHLEVGEYKANTIAKLRTIHDSVEQQRRHMQAFQDDYNDLLRKYLTSFDESDLSLIYDHIDDLEKYIREISSSVEEEEYQDEDDMDDVNASEEDED